MKVCLIFPNYPPNYQMDGIGDYTYILVQELRNLGEVQPQVDVSVIASKKYSGDDKRVYKIGNLNWGVVELFKVLRIVRRNFDDYITPFDDYITPFNDYITPFNDYITPFDDYITPFDILHLQYTPETYGYGISFKFLPLLMRILIPHTRFIITFHTLVGGKRISYFNAFLLSIFSHKIISTNEELTFLFKRRLWFLAHKLVQIPIGSNILPIQINKEKAKLDIRTKYNIPAHATLLSNFGFPAPNKGLETLFNALKILNSLGNYILILVGTTREEDKNYRAELLKLIDKLELKSNILWMEQLDEQEVSQVLFASDIYVVPYREGMSTRHGSLMAGIVHSLPIVSTYPRVNYPYFIDGVNVILVEPENPSKLADAIHRIANDALLRNNLAQNISKLASKFSWSDIACKTIEVYKRG
ncbi:MAG: glycosyltransferase [Candidatus Stahlbacteria bacterium]|nr:glycosyltransferase [Candidatus Stahlbacteria bacterium]